MSPNASTASRLQRRATDIRTYVMAAVVLAASGVSVRSLQPKLGAALHAMKGTDDIYAFPPPAVLRVATLGYVAATTDYLWGKLLVEHGTHWSEHRPFPDLNRYLDALIGLDPTFHPFYEFVDTLLCYRPPRGYEADARAARAYLERGTEALPNDPDIWLHYGQFVTFLAPSFLGAEVDRQAWRHDGAVALTHAVELGASMQSGIAASAILGDRFGEREASIRSLERQYVITDDEAYRLEIAGRLEILQASRASELGRDTIRAVEARWRRDFPFLDRGTYLLLGPTTDPLRCAGRAASLDRACARDWDPALGN